LLRNFLRPQVLLDGHGVVGAALHRGVVADDHAVHAVDAADARDHARTGCIVVVHVEGRQRRHFEEGRAGVEQVHHAIARQELAAGGVLGAGGFAAALGDTFQVGAQVIDHGLHGLRIGRELGRAGIELGLQNGHGQVLFDRMWPPA